MGLGAAIIVVGVLATLVEIRAPGDGFDHRPIGTAEDLIALRDRDDLNVLFILIDTLRADRLGSYGHENDTSPALDRLAAQGVRFARHLAQSSWTKASMASLWTGLYPTRTGVTRFDDILAEEARLPAEVLKENGFLTAGIYRNGWVAHTFGFDQGFDVYQRPAPGAIPANAIRQNPSIAMKGTDEDIVAGALEFLRIDGQSRWFVYLHFMDLHEYTYDAESALFGSTYSGIYDNSIRWTDGTIEVLLDHLGAGGHLENTIVVVTSDHGEAFQERGFEGHARKVYRESTEVPLILSLPFRLEPGIVLETRSRGIDVWPTLYDLLGIDIPPRLDGRSLVPQLIAAAKGEEFAGGDELAITHLDQTWGRAGHEARPTVAVTDGSLRYVRTNQGRETIEQLFDSAIDPAELEDRAEEQSDVLEGYREITDAYLADEPDWGEAPTRDLNELELNQLRALGYALP
jgi:arylsulfatase A-like enzyme